MSRGERTVNHSNVKTLNLWGTHDLRAENVDYLLKAIISSFISCADTQKFQIFKLLAFIWVCIKFFFSTFCVQFSGGGFQPVDLLLLDFISNLSFLLFVLRSPTSGERPGSRFIKFNLLNVVSFNPWDLFKLSALRYFSYNKRARFFRPFRFHSSV